MDLLPSDASWPRHTNPEWRETLRMARGRHWYFRPSVNHIFGKLQCRDAPPGQRCEQIVYSSGTATDNVARSTRQKIDRCPHVVPGSDSAEATLPMTLGQIETCIFKAERLLSAARACQREVSHRARCEELLAEADADLDQCDVLLELATASDGAATEAAASVTKHLAAAERSDLALDSPTLVDEAEDLLDTADSGLKQSETKGRATRLRQRVGESRQGVTQLRNLLRT